MDRRQGADRGRLRACLEPTGTDCRDQDNDGGARVSGASGCVSERRQVGWGKGRSAWSPSGARRGAPEPRRAPTEAARAGPTWASTEAAKDGAKPSGIPKQIKSAAMATKMTDSAARRMNTAGRGCGSAWLLIYPESLHLPRRKNRRYLRSARSRPRRTAARQPEARVRFSALAGMCARDGEARGTGSSPGSTRP